VAVYLSDIRHHANTQKNAKTEAIIPRKMLSLNIAEIIEIPINQHIKVNIISPYFLFESLISVNTALTALISVFKSCVRTIIRTAIQNKCLPSIIFLAYFKNMLPNFLHVS
jgi:hypothetical protein